MVFQEQSLVANLTVAQNIYLGREKKYSKAGLVNWKEMNKDAKKALERVDIETGARAKKLGILIWQPEKWLRLPRCWML